MHDGESKHYGGSGGEASAPHHLQRGEHIISVAQLSTRKCNFLGIEISFELSSGRVIQFQGSMHNQVSNKRSVCYKAKKSSAIVGLEFDKQGLLVGINEQNW